MGFFIYTFFILLIFYLYIIDFYINWIFYFVTAPLNRVTWIHGAIKMLSLLLLLIATQDLAVCGDTIHRSVAAVDVRHLPEPTGSAAVSSRVRRPL